jgi:hypothetical protein
MLRSEIAFLDSRTYAQHYCFPNSLTYEVRVEHGSQQLLTLGEGAEDLTAGEG